MYLLITVFEIYTFPRGQHSDLLPLFGDQWRYRPVVVEATVAHHLYKSGTAKCSSYGYGFAVLAQ